MDDPMKATNPAWSGDGSTVPLTEKLIRKFITQIKTRAAVDAAAERVRRDRITRDGCPHDAVYAVYGCPDGDVIRCLDCGLDGYALRLALGLE